MSLSLQNDGRILGGYQQCSPVLIPDDQMHRWFDDFRKSAFVQASALLICGLRQRLLLEFHQYVMRLISQARPT